MAIVWGGLQPYELGISNFIDAFYNWGYEKRRIDKNHFLDVPLNVRGWRINVVELDQIYVVLAYRPNFTPPWSGIEVEAYPKSNIPQLANCKDVEEAAQLLKMGEIIAYKAWPSSPSQYLHDPNNTELITKFGTEWGVSLADEHIANTHPSFHEANKMMTEAYSKLFELENMLRNWIEQTLATVHGPNWWNTAKIDPDIKKDVSTKQSDTRGAWLDDYDSSTLRFADFPHLRIIIFANESKFHSVLGNSNWFKTTLGALEPIRNRIGHVNTLSRGDVQNFYRDANRIIAAIRPHVQMQ